MLGSNWEQSQSSLFSEFARCYDRGGISFIQINIRAEYRRKNNKPPTHALLNNTI